MATKSSTFRLHLLPTTPLEARQRSYHRLRSSRKLEAGRGLTPLFLALDSRVDGIISDSTSTLISPRTRATRRKGQIFISPSSPTPSIESDYVFVNARVLSDLHLHSPSSSRSPSPTGNPVTNDNHNLEIPAEVQFGDRTKTIATEAPQPLAQPYLLQFPTLPVHTTNINSIDLPVHHPEQQQLITPMSSTFNIYSTSSYPRRGHVLTEAEKRKLAKLSRTLGENIPPELVFHASPPPVQRSISTSSSRTRRYHKPSPSLAVQISPPSPIIVAPSLPTPPTPTPPSPLTESKPPVKPRGLARPQSMTLTRASPVMATPSIRGASLDGVPSDHAPFQGITVSATESNERSNAGLEWNKRKGQGWSGEWNRDMKHVAKVLRGLKAR